MTAIDMKIEMMNQIINSAINYGGDPGGPYLTDSCWGALYESVSIWMRYENISKERYEFVRCNPTSNNRWCEIRKKV